MNPRAACQHKVSFNTKKKAALVAAKFGQRVYECPICFCWHCTKKERWEDEFVRVETHVVALSQQESAIRGELNEKNRKLTQEVFELQQEVKKLKKLLHGRDDFIVEQGLWPIFTAQLEPRSPANG